MPHNTTVNSRLPASRSPVRSDRPTGPAFRWPGSKWRLTGQLLPLFPHHRRYVSLFGGSASDILAKPPSHVEVFNDLSSDVYNFFKVIRDDRSRKRLLHMLIYTPYSRQQYVDCLSILQSNESEIVMRAWAFVTCANCGFVGIDPSIATKGNFAPDTAGSVPAKWRDIAHHIEKVARRFRQVMIENRDWREVLARYDNDETLIYADPPYIHAARVCNSQYAHELVDDDHAELLRLLMNSRAKVILSGYSNELYDEALAGWRREEFSARCYIANAKYKPSRIEVVWMNFFSDSGVVR